MKREYSHAFTVRDGEFRMNELKIAIHSLGNNSYKTSVSYIPPTGVISPAKHLMYIAVCLGSSGSWRQWEPVKFVAAINQIIEKWRIPLYLVGGEVERKIYHDIRDDLLYGDYIFDYTCKTSMEEWVELIRGAKFLISSDTGVVHLAAAVRTPSICILGGWQYGILHPYRPDILHPEDSLPHCVYNQVTKRCYGCARSSGSRYGLGNPACSLELKKGNPVLCLQEISVGEVLLKVGQLMEVNA